MHPELEELRPRLKEILYDCAVEIKATKAALYFFDGVSRFDLITEYGFRGSIRASADMNDALVDRCGRGRTPFYVNGVAAEARFSELLFESSTDRLLAAPLYSRGKLIGFIDMRDKGGKQPFEQPDLAKAQNIAERMAEVVSSKAIFGHRFISLSDAGGGNPNVVTRKTAAPTATTAPAAHEARPQAKPAAEPVHAFVAPPLDAHVPLGPAAPPVQIPAATRGPSLATVVIESRNRVAHLDSGVRAETLGDAQLVAAREALRSVLLIPGAVATVFSAFGHLGGVQEIAARSTLSDEARQLIQSKLTVWLGKRGVTPGFVTASVTTPFGSATATVSASDIQKVFTAPLSIGAMTGLYLTVAFDAPPARVSHELLTVLHGHMQLVIEQSMQRGALASLQSKIAAKLVEPDFARFSELRRHSESVARLCETFGRHLALTPPEVEAARLVGLVHDVGMRLLDYERLYTKTEVSQEEVAFLREHPIVGAAMVEPLLGATLARAVLSHHERFDGSGYPNALAGEEIPLFSRMVAICDSWIAMTDPHYQAATSPEQALETIRRLSGTQFDPLLAATFIEMARR